MYASAGVGAIATQALANTRYGPDRLALLAAGSSPDEVVKRLTSADEARDHRQPGVIDAVGRAAGHTGQACIPWAGGRLAEGLAVHGNILAGQQVVDAMFEAFTAGGQPFPELLLEALRAADDAGGDRRGRQATALLVAREAGGYGGPDDHWIDVRVDDHHQPIDELARLHALTRLYRDRPSPGELLPIDEVLAAELRSRLTSLGYVSVPDFAPNLSAYTEVDGVQRTGEPRALAAGWDETWQAVLEEWLAVENLEERFAARGWIDPRAMEFLRERSQA